MTYLLDTNICVSYLRGQSTGKIAARLSAARQGDIVLCSVVAAELLYGGHRSSRPSETINQVRQFCSRFRSLPFDDASAEEYGRIRAALASIGKPIGPNDLMIAAIALANGVTLVTNNTAEFGRVPGLSIEDWQIS